MVQFVMVILLGILGLYGTTAVSLGGASSTPERVIAFTSTRDGPDPHIYVMRADGRAVRRVTRRHGDEPSWSPDGRRIAFSRVFDSPDFVGASIWVIRPDGTRESRVTRDREAHWEPTWAPDGRRIAFEVWARNGSGIAVVSARGGRRRPLTRLDGDDHSPAWSPDGRRIVFSRGAENRADLYVMNSDGSAEQRLRRHVGADVNPSWSPDGRSIAFGSNAGGAAFRLYVMRADGTHLRRLTSQRGGQPAWSPDSKRIIFASGRQGDPELYTVDADGSNERRLTDNAVDDVHPDWRR